MSSDNLKKNNVIIFKSVLVMDICHAGLMACAEPVEVRGVRGVYLILMYIIMKFISSSIEIAVFFSENRNDILNSLYRNCRLWIII